MRRKTTSKYKPKAPPNTVDLRTWMFEEEHTLQSLAADLKCSIQTVNRWKNGDIPEAWKIVLEIEALSKGRVTFYNLVIPKKKSNKDNKNHEQESED